MKCSKYNERWNFSNFSKYWKIILKKDKKLEIPKLDTIRKHYFICKFAYNNPKTIASKKADLILSLSAMEMLAKIEYNVDLESEYELFISKKIKD